jgi:hypothetical protein
VIVQIDVHDQLELPTSDPMGKHSSPAIAPAPPVPTTARPQIRLQQGIHKPKVHTDGIVRYAQLTTTGEPSSVCRRLLVTGNGNKLWIVNIMPSSRTTLGI